LALQGVRLISLPRLVRDVRPFSDLCALISLLRIFWFEKPHIVHTHTSKAGILGRWAAFLCRVPTIIHTPHGHVFWGYFDRWQTRLFVLLERWPARITDAEIVLTPQEREAHLRFLGVSEQKFTIIHSGVELRKFSFAVGREIPSNKQLHFFPRRPSSWNPWVGR
jgi:glycosyltransferase involved in cell wall biosynthesis